MYCLTTEHSFDSAHFLWGYEGKCSNIHGHRWRVIVEVQSENLQDNRQSNGMVVDFGKLKEDLKIETDFLDHAFLIEKQSLKEKTLQVLEEEGFRIIQMENRPTAENIAKYFYKKMSKKGYQMKTVQVYETPNNSALYQEDPHEVL